MGWDNVGIRRSKDARSMKTQYGKGDVGESSGHVRKKWGEMGRGGKRSGW